MKGGQGDPKESTIKSFGDEFIAEVHSLHYGGFAHRNNVARSWRHSWELQKATGVGESPPQDSLEQANCPQQQHKICA